MSTQNSRFQPIWDPFVDNLQNTNEDVRRRATDELYERIIVQYADVSQQSTFFDLFICFGSVSCRRS
jgi:hypothetical protein